MPPLLPSASAACSLHISKFCYNPQVSLPAKLRKVLYATRHSFIFCCLVVQAGCAGQEAAKMTPETAIPQQMPPVLMQPDTLCFDNLLSIHKTTAAHWPFMSCHTHPSIALKARRTCLWQAEGTHCDTLHAENPPGATPRRACVV